MPDRSDPPPASVEREALRQLDALAALEGDAAMLSLAELARASADERGGPEPVSSEP